MDRNEADSKRSEIGTGNGNELALWKQRGLTEGYAQETIEDQWGIYVCLISLFL